MIPQGFRANNAGGILGGISTGQDILVSLAIKPASSIRLKWQDLDVEGKPAEVSVTAAMIRWSAYVPCPSQKPCSRSRSWIMPCGIVPRTPT